VSTQRRRDITRSTRLRTRVIVWSAFGLLCVMVLWQRGGSSQQSIATILFLEKASVEAQSASQNPPLQVQNKQQTLSYYDESKIVRFSDKLVKAPQTIVTAYFDVPSKHSSENYNKWMKNMLSLQDPMVIFLSPSLIPKIKALREHALNRTIIIPMEAADVPIAKKYNTSFWQWQLDIDKEKKIHRGYQVFFIWLSKSWWVTQAIRHNFFDSQVFVWSDMGCFRHQEYNGRQMVQHMETIPRRSMLFLAHHPTLPPPSRIWNNKYDQPQHHYTSGSMIAAYADTFLKFHDFFLETIQEFLDRDMFIGEDQVVLQSTCLLHPDMCAYVTYTQIKDNHYFGLRYILHYGGNYTYWYPPVLR
jgi:Bacterial protein of unknown function (HtrL_YibB)